MFFFHLTVMHSGNIVPGILGTRSSCVGNIEMSILTFPGSFTKWCSAFRVPVPRSQCFGNMASKVTPHTPGGAEHRVVGVDVGDPVADPALWPVTGSQQTNS
jgi:hypothetical protein